MSARQLKLQLYTHSFLVFYSQKKDIRERVSGSNISEAVLLALEPKEGDFGGRIKTN